MLLAIHLRTRPVARFPPQLSPVTKIFLPGRDIYNNIMVVGVTSSSETLQVVQHPDVAEEDLLTSPGIGSLRCEAVVYREDGSVQLC